jgi:23S rRNA (guanosine2251-2'-O)-methyltransferase
MQKESIKFESSTVFEGMTSIRALIKGIDEGITDRKLIKLLFDKERKQKIHKELGYLRAISEKYGFEIVESDAHELEKITLGSSHGGLVLLATDRTLPRLSIKTPLRENGFYVMLEGIEDPYNFGYCLRSLYAMGCDGIILTERNWMSAAGVVCRSSAGASEVLPIYVTDGSDVIDIFKGAGFTVISADENTDNILGECPLELPLLLIVGGEKRGISKKLLSGCDMLVKIDYSRDFRASLSAASATTMFAYEIRRQNKS